MFKSIGKLAFSGMAYLAKESILTRTKGAEFLSSDAVSSFLSSRGKGLLLDGNDLRLSMKESFQNVLLAARIGTGKTTKYIIPNVLDKASRSCSLVVNDPKGEVYQLTSGYMKAKGFNVVVFNPNDIENSDYFNPFVEAKTEIELDQLSETIIWSGNPTQKDRYWNDGASRIVSVLIKCLSFGDKKNFNLPNLYHLLQNFGSVGEGLDDWVHRNCWNPDCPSDDYIFQDWKGALTGNVEAIQSFVGVCLTAIKSLSNRQLRKFFSHSNYDLDRLRREKTIIYFITPPEHQKYYSFVTSLFFRSIFNECMRSRHLSGSSLPVYILYDEFGNSFITDFVSVANTIRGFGVSLSIILQSISQLEDKYGKATSEAIQGAFNTSVCFDSSDPKTSDYFSKLAGRVREEQLKIHRSSGFGMVDISSENREFNLLNSNEVRTMSEEEVLIVSRNRNPAKIPITPYFRNRRMKKMTRFPCVAVYSNSASNIDLVAV